MEKSNYQYMVLEIDEQTANISRDTLLKVLTSENVLARRYFYPGCHQMEPYRSYHPHAGLLLPETERLVGKVLTLPTGSGVDKNDIKLICEIIKTAVLSGKEIEGELNPSMNDEFHINNPPFKQVQLRR